MSLSTKARHVHRILPHPGEHPSEPNSFGGFEPATTLPRRTGQVASALHESMWQYHKYRSLYVRPELRCNEQRAGRTSAPPYLPPLSISPALAFPSRTAHDRVEVFIAVLRSPHFTSAWCPFTRPGTGLPSRACNRAGK